MPRDQEKAVFIVWAKPFKMYPDHTIEWMEKPMVTVIDSNVAAIKIQDALEQVEEFIKLLSYTEGATLKIYDLARTKAQRVMKLDVLKSMTSIAKYAVIPESKTKVTMEIPLNRIFFATIVTESTRTQSQEEAAEKTQKVAEFLKAIVE
jgi:hypothetical protein